MEKIIDSFSNNYFFLSNFYISPMVIDNKQYLTNEHYFQAMKAADSQDSEMIRIAKTPGEAKKLGRKVKLIDDWDQFKDGIMMKGLKIKFSDPILKNKLLNTLGYMLIEGNTWNDTYWGVCNGVGQNRLGKLLMELRNTLNVNK